MITIFGDFFITPDLDTSFDEAFAFSDYFELWYLDLAWLRFLVSEVSKYYTSTDQPLSCIKPTSALWITSKIIYTKKTNISHMVKFFESLFACKQGDQILQDHFGHI